MYEFNSMIKPKVICSKYPYPTF